MQKRPDIDLGPTPEISSKIKQANDIRIYCSNFLNEHSV